MIESGTANLDMLSLRVLRWQRHVKAVSVVKFRVTRNNEVIGDFEPSEDVANEIGEFLGNLAECEGQSVTAQIHAIAMDQGGAERTVSQTTMRVQLAVAPPIQPATDRTLEVLTKGYGDLAGKVTEMVGGLTKTLETLGNMNAKLVSDSIQRADDARKENTTLEEIARDALAEAKVLKATGDTSSRARLEKLLANGIIDRIEKVAGAFMNGMAGDAGDAGGPPPSTDPGQA